MAMEKEKLVILVTKAQNGDNEAMNELFNAFYNDLYYFALKTVKDEDLALDVTQEAFIEIINTIGKLEEPAAFVTWAKQITYHQCTRYFKKKKDVIVDEDEEGNTVFDNLKEENAEFIPDEALDKDDFKKTILAILDELSEEQRSAVMMYYFDEMSIKQIAEIQGTTEGTVKSRLNYARKAIKASVEEYEEKNGIKLHAIPCLPLLKWIFEGAFDGGLSAASAEAVASGVAAATGTSVAVASTAAATTTAATVTTTATAVGIGAKIAALPLVTKIIAGIAAVTIAVGGTTTAVILSMDKDEKQKNPPVVAVEDELVLEGTIPEGCTYTLHDGTELKAGEKFPATCTAGDWVKYGDYYYGYEAMYVLDGEMANTWCLWKDYFDAIDSGLIDSDVYGTWSVMTPDRSKTEYGQIASRINGVTVKNMYGTFFGCEKMTKAPKIPSTVTAMTGAFYGCKALKTAPILPKNVQRIMLTFAECTSLQGDVVINITLDKSYHWLYSDTFMRTTNNINLVGETPEEDLILIAKASDNKNITVNGKAVDYSPGEAEILSSLKDKFKALMSPLKFSRLPYFSNVNEITSANAFWCAFWSLNDLTQYQTGSGVGSEGIEFYYSIPISSIDNETKKYFGKVFDYSAIKGEADPYCQVYTADYNPTNHTIDIVECGGAGDPYHPEVTECIKLDDSTYQVNISWYDGSSEPPNSNEKDWYQSEDGDSYWIADRWEKMIVKYVDGDWTIQSYSER